MKLKDITSAIASRTGIMELNPMQLQMLQTPSRHIILTAPTGSGKTLAFAIRLLREAEGGRGVNAVVIAPTRELVLQIYEVMRPIVAGSLRIAVAYGGHSMLDETRSFEASPDIIVATPGRLVDHITRRSADIRGARTLVLDEYDKCLELGFADQMRRIASTMRSASMVVLTSATGIREVPEKLGDISEYTEFDFSSDNAPEEAGTVEIVEVPSDSPDKLDTLVRLLRSLPDGSAIVFVNHRESAERVYQRLRTEGLPAGLYHGALDQRERRLAVDMLDNGSTPILVATDLASRGLDTTGVNYVIHYHLPLKPEVWTHRNGRTARHGRSGEVYIITSPKDSANLPEYVGAPDRVAEPAALTDADNPISRHWATLYFDAGKREKISRGDIAGFLMQKGALRKDQVGKIIVDDHFAIAAVPADLAGKVVSDVAPYRLKNRRVRVTLLKTK